MRVEIVPCLSDNYAYVLIDDAARECAVVDASEAGPLSTALSRIGLPLTAIFSTHHHFDHVGGNEALLAAHPGAVVYGHRSDVGRLPGLSRPLDDGARVAFGTCEVRAHHVPGHTLGALAYEVRAHDGARWLFTGDTLFLAGCGRLFEGTAEQMFTSLSSLAALGDDVLVACGHEYTLSNLRFAAHVEPENALIRERLAEESARRQRGEPTVPAPMSYEKATNPFLRARDVATFAARRADKDTFRG